MRKSGAWRRGVASAVVGATALGASLSGVAGAQAAPTPEAVDIEPFCMNVPGNFRPFSDPGPTFPREIACAFAAQVANGFDDGTYGPGLGLRRGQMASLVARMIDTANSLDTEDVLVDLGPAPAEDAFTDVSANNVHRGSINRLAEAGIVSGGPGNLPDSQFGPGRVLTRGQMATVLVQAIEFMIDADLEAEDDYFTDDATNVHQPRINVAAAFGIALGTGPQTFSPGRTVNRGQMAAFVVRTLAVFEQEGDITPLPFIDATLSGATFVDSGAGTATVTFVVRNGADAAVTGLAAGDIAYTFAGGRHTLATGPFAGFWSNFAETSTPGNYTVTFTPPAPGTYTATDIAVRGVIIEASLDVEVTGMP